jgi:hypothetical protein
MICDVCNVPVAEDKVIRVSPERFRQLMKQGFGIHETNIGMLTDAGISREEAVAALTAQYSVSHSFWMLCPECSQEAKKLL